MSQSGTSKQKRIQVKTAKEKAGEEKPKYTQWHPAFCSAIKLELRRHKEDLTFQTEVGLNFKPILIDLLVITKKPGIIIDNEIGHIFKGYNIFEFKSPGDALNIDTFYKGIAYASLYKANAETVDGIKADDITITFVRNEFPGKMIRTLEEQGMEILETAKGIYRIKSGFPFEIQLIMPSMLEGADNIWLRSLSRNLSEQEARRLIHSSTVLTEKDDKEYADSVLQVATKENHDIFEIVKEGDDMCEALMELMKPEIDEKIDKKINEALTKRDEEYAAVLTKRDEEYAASLSQKDAALSQKDAEIQRLRALLAAKG